MDLGLRRSFKWNFVVADVSKPIIGADFLIYYGLLVDLKNKQLYDSKTELKSKCSSKMTSQITEIKTIPITITYKSLLEEYHEITKPRPFTLKDTKHNVVHRIETHCNPISSKPRRLDPEKFKVDKKKFKTKILRKLFRIRLKFESVKKKVRECVFISIGKDFVFKFI